MLYLKRHLDIIIDFIKFPPVLLAVRKYCRFCGIMKPFFSKKISKRHKVNNNKD
jgi:hypothetical protein